MACRTSRRRFLATAATSTAAFTILPSGSARTYAANERLNIASIGAGGRAASVLRGVESQNIVALCDVDEQRAAESFARYPNAQRFKDYRAMLDQLHGSIDAVIVATPDHHHFHASMAALRLGKHVYCEKPLTHSVWEARQLTAAAREAGVATQMGNQAQASKDTRRVQEFLLDNAIGPVREVHIWTDRPGRGLDGEFWAQGIARPGDAAAVPSTLDWDLWLGPAPSRPYNPAYVPFAWRGWWDFGTGALGDMACHVLNMPFRALELRDPVAVQATTSGHNRDSYPNWSVIDFEFPANANRDALKLTWYDGGKRPDRALVGAEEELPGNGVIVVGENATLFSPDAYGSKFTIIGDLQAPDVEIDRSPGHFQEWVRAIGGGKAGASNFTDVGGPLTETVLLGNLAVWAAHEADTPGQRVEWDAPSMTPTNAPELAAIVRPELQHGYEL